MKTTKKSILMALCCLPAAVCAGETSGVSLLKLPSQARHNIKIGIEVGAESFWGDYNSLARIREPATTWYDYTYAYYDSYYGGGVPFSDQKVQDRYVGIKPEFFFAKNRCGLAVGLRYTSFRSRLSTDRDYFLWRLSAESAEDMDLVRIRSFRQRQHYIGIPVELRFFPNSRDLPFQHYFKIGTVLNCQVATTNRISFANQAMSKYSATVSGQIPDGDAFNMTAFAAIGVKVGRYHSWGTIEFRVPWFFASTSSASSFVSPTAGVGCNMSLLLPWGKQAPMRPIFRHR
ncbi:MAG: hypothetical protein LBR06_06845 [Bacteroidales bacterium]|jgi:hypothetical protein|nr:hypothetical protein [Bacteroidales bacterium]